MCGWFKVRFLGLFKDLFLKVKPNLKLLPPLCWWWCHTVEAFFCLLNGEQRSCVTNWRFHILIHRSIIPSSSLQWSNGWCLNNGFFAPTHLCPVSYLSHKLLTLRSSSPDSVVAFCLPDLSLSELPPGFECLRPTVLSDTLTFVQWMVPQCAPTLLFCLL